MTHHVSDIDGFNNVRMRDQNSLNSLMASLKALDCDLNLNDASWMNPARYPGLFGGVPTDSAIFLQHRQHEGLSDESLLEILKSGLPREARFYRFKQLDEMLSLPDGTASRLALDAARARERLGRVTRDGITLLPPRVVRRA